MMLSPFEYLEQYVGTKEAKRIMLEDRIIWNVWLEEYEEYVKKYNPITKCIRGTMIFKDKEHLDVASYRILSLDELETELIQYLDDNQTVVESVSIKNDYNDYSCLIISNKNTTIKYETRVMPLAVLRCVEKMFIKFVICKDLGGEI